MHHPTPSSSRPALTGLFAPALTALLALTVAACGPAAEETPSADAQEVSTTVYAPQNRPDVRGTVGAVSAGHPLAAQAGLEVLKDGGTATDAIIAMAGVLAVTRPHMNGIGGDAFGIFYDGETGEVTAINASGRSGALATPEFFTEAGYDEIPGSGALSVSVPGAVAGWVDAHARYGNRPFDELLAPAIRFARDGFPVSTRLALDFEAQGGDLNEPGRALYLPDGSPPPVGSLLVNRELATSLEAIARGGKQAFYQGPIAQRLADFVAEQGGHLRADDFAAHTSTWVEPLRNDYLGHTFVVMPPNTQGPAQLAYMEMAKAFPLAEMGHNSAEYLHTLIELKKLAFADRDRWVADPEKADVPIARMLDDEYLRERATLVDPSQAAEDVAPGFGDDHAATQEDADDAGDTVYLTAVDQYGNAVSWIQSNFAGFGSGILEPETGILLHNRGSLYTLEEGHPNQVAPNKRPYHTLSPMMALHEDGTFAFTLGTPGGDSQPQSLLQIVNNLLLFEMTPQEAIEAPRFRSFGGTRIALENRVSPEALEGLMDRGHEINVIDGWTATFGGAQGIVYDAGNGVLSVGSDPRREAYGLAY
ncbi:MAG: gamma-glutamyltransferase [Longimicrobiales bacterium]|nr:gamma-glutamyltransferase [Longimicrobiales bacterium]